VKDKKKYMTVCDVNLAAYRCSRDIVARAEQEDLAGLAKAPHDVRRIYGVPRGGVPAAFAVLAHLGDKFSATDRIEMADYIVDDIIDSGETRARHEARYPEKPFFALVRRNPGMPYIVFPWEGEEAADNRSDRDIVTRLLQRMGEDPGREGLRETPDRVLRAWDHYCQGYTEEPADVLKVFEDGTPAETDEMILVRDIPIYSHCEHHLAPFFGHAHIAYIPSTKILGLSKFARLAGIFARRLQVQERLTAQIADALISSDLAPRGVGVVLECRHMCMESRGVRVVGASTTTSALRGVFKNPEVRQEFLRLVR